LYINAKMAIVAFGGTKSDTVPNRFTKAATLSNCT
jgi:hypothetical protein